MKTVKHFFSLSMTLGWQDVKDTFQRSTLGPFWVTISVAVQATVVGLIFGVLFGLDPSVYLPYLTISLVLWNFLVATITDETLAYIQHEQLLRQVKIPLFLPTFRTLTKNFLIFLHNALLIVAVLLFAGAVPSPVYLLAIPGLVLLATNAYLFGSLSAIVATRFRDVPPIVSSGLMVSFYFTPIIWLPDSLPDDYRELILLWNPFYHLMEIVRGPLLGEVPSAFSWLLAASIMFLLAGILVWAHRRYGWRIVYWL